MSSNNLYGFPQPISQVFPPPIIASVAPTTSDYQYPLGQEWIDKVGQNAYILVNVASNTATWAEQGGTAGPVDTLTGGTGGAISPSAGNISILGTSNQLTSTGSAGGHSITFSLPAAVTAPGSLTTTTGLTAGTTFSATGGASTFVGTFHANVTGAATSVIGTGGTGATNIGNATGNTAVTGSLTASTTLTATLGNITATNGNLVLTAAGNKLQIHASATATDSAGTFTLGGGATTVVSCSAVTANSLILLTPQALGTVSIPSALAVTATSANTSFTVTPSDSTDTSTVAYLIIN